MKDKFQKLGSTLQQIVTKNLILFFLIGIVKILRLRFDITIFHLELVENYILPVMIAYTTGNTVDKKYGGVIGIISIFCLLGKIRSLAIVIFLAFFTVKIVIYLNKKISEKVYSGFEMLVSNIFISSCSLVVGYFYLRVYNHLVDSFNFTLLGDNLKFDNIIFIILLTPFIEIGKVFFLNNIINYGVLSLLGYSDTISKDTSLFFLLESNPGTGFGFLIGYLYGKKLLKRDCSIPLIQFFGGIHEVYFPYILKNLKLLLGVIIGGIVGNVIFFYGNVGLYTIPAPGSIITVLLFTKNKIITFLGILISALASGIITYMLVKNNKKIEEIKEIKNIEKIYIICSGGMGTSVMAKKIFLRLLKEKNRDDIEVESLRLGEKIEKNSIIITHINLLDRVKKYYENIKILGVDNYLDKENYIKLIDNIPLKNINIDDDIEIEMNKKSNEFNNEYLKFLYSIERKIAFIKKNNEKIKVEHYPYGISIKNKKVLLILIGNEKKLIKWQKKLENIDIQRLEILDDRREMMEILGIEEVKC